MQLYVHVSVFSTGGDWAYRRGTSYEKEVGGGLQDQYETQPAARNPLASFSLDGKVLQGPK